MAKKRQCQRIGASDVQRWRRKPVPLGGPRVPRSYNDCYVKLAFKNAFGVLGSKYPLNVAKTPPNRLLPIPLHDRPTSVPPPTPILPHTGPSRRQSRPLPPCLLMCGV